MDALIIDGYSLLFRSGAAPRRIPGGIEKARARLIERITRAQAQLPRRILLVFDGRASSRAFNLPSTRVEILFSTGAQSADLLIEELIRREPRPGEVKVVTSDRRVTERAQFLARPPPPARTSWTPWKRRKAASPARSSGLETDRAATSSATISPVSKRREGRPDRPLSAPIFFQ
jgi:hypothetical protein